MGVVVEFFTNDPTIVDLCARYWALDEDGRFLYRVSDLPLPLGIAGGRVAAFVGEHCHAYDPEVMCQSCGRPYIFFASRSEYQQRSRSSWQFRQPCTDCRRAQMEREQAARRAAEEGRRSQIRDLYGVGVRERVIACDELSFREAVALLALLRFAASEGLGAISPVEEAGGLFAPTTDLAVDLLVLLWSNGCIWVHPESAMSAFADDLSRVYPLRATWLPPVAEDGRPGGVLDDLESIFRQEAWPEEWFPQSLAFWHEVALHECLQYLKVCMEEHGFELKLGDKTRQVIDGVLENYSPAQAYNLIWRAAKDAAAYLMRSNVSRQQAANSAIGSIQRMAERALAEGWEVKPYRRDRRAPESMVSHVLYRVALKLAGDGIDHIPDGRIGRQERSSPKDVHRGG